MFSAYQVQRRKQKKAVSVADKLKARANAEELRSKLLTLAKRGGFSTTSLTRENLTQKLGEGSEAARQKFASDLEGARTALQGTLATTDNVILKMVTGDYAAIAKQREDGALTDAARDAIYGRAYLRTLHGYAQALLTANIRSPEALRDIKRINATLESINEMKPPQQAQTLGRLMRAESREQLLSAVRVDPTNLNDLRVPNERARITAKTNAAVNAAARFEQKWKKNGFFNNTIGPFMRKLVSYVTSDGRVDSQLQLGFQPVMEGGPVLKREMEAVKFALRMLRSKEATRNDFYKPFRTWLEQFGFEFKNGELVIPDSIPARLLLVRRYNRRFGERDVGVLSGDLTSYHTPDGSELDPRPVDTRTDAQIYEDFKSGVQYSDKLRDTPYITPAGTEKAAVTVAVNKAITALRRTVSRSNATTLDVLAAEERFVAYLKEAGLWKDAGVGGQLGRISLPSRSMTVRLIGPRLRKGDLTTAEAKQAMLDLYQPVRVNPETLGDQGVQQAAAKTFADVESRRTRSYKKAERERQKTMTPEQRKVMRAYEARDRARNALDLVGESATDPQYVEAGNNLMTLLDETQGSVSLNDALIAMWRALPSDSPLGILAQRILDLDLDVEVRMDSSATMGAAAGKFTFGGGEMTIRLNRDAFARMTADGKNTSAAIAHALLHEAVHAATVGGLRSNPAVMSALRFLWSKTSEQLRANGSKAYGLASVDEFVAEAFSNTQFQTELRAIRFSPEQSMWQKFIGFLKELLGFPPTTPVENALDAVMLTTDAIFKGVDVRNWTKQDLNLDVPTNNKVADVLGRLKQNVDVRRSLAARSGEAKENAANGVLAVMTMEQIRDFFSRHFRRDMNAKRAVDRNPLSEYWRAFGERNASNSEMMESADKISRDWTKITEDDLDGALEVSRIMTEATLYEVHPHVPLSDELNKHVVAPERKAKHAELAKRMKALKGDLPKHYDNVRAYYRTTLEREITLQTLNALRAMVTAEKTACRRMCSTRPTTSRRSRPRSSTRRKDCGRNSPRTS
ncbi:MAG: hypothetical protein HC793_00135 [Aquincola sp.]|nr:hypothetical protein [Aquincola sp.]